MKAPLSWLNDFVDIDLPVDELARLITMAGMEVEGLRIIGLPMPDLRLLDAQVIGLEWDRENIVVASILEVMPHPNADRLVLCKLFDGKQEHIVLTGAPNLFEYKGIGPLSTPLKVAYAKEGAQIFDGHQEGQVLTTLKRTKIRGVESYSMVCSEKELGISDEHEGIMILPEDAEVGMPLVDYMGDAVLDVKLLPSYARCASMRGLAREIAAMTGKPMKASPEIKKEIVNSLKIGLADFAEIQITNPELNPRFVLGLIRNIGIRPSPEWVQRRLKLAGMRPINNIVDATNYVMLEIGEPLHAFDYDILVKRAKGKKVKIITRTAGKGEKLTTLDEVERTLDESTVLVCDEAGSLSIAGVMGGMESEISERTTSVLLEGAAWNFINIRKTAQVQLLPSEASYRFSRGVHPSMAEHGVRRGLELMSAWAGGEVDSTLVDNYPQPPKIVEVEVSAQDVKRWLGLNLSANEISILLERLEFDVEVKGETVRATCPDHRMDIGEGITGKADLIEEVARIYGYDNIPETRMADLLPPQLGNPELDKEERLRDQLVYHGLTEVISYRWTTPEREGRRLPVDETPDDKPYLRIVNPLAYEKGFLRHSVLASILDTAEKNARVRDRLAFFEIGPAFLPSEGGDLPDEQHRVAILLTGPRNLPGWQPADTNPMDFYDLKGMLVDIFNALCLPTVSIKPGKHPSLHPGKCAVVMCEGKQIAVFGELHPKVRNRYDFPPAHKSPIITAEIDLDSLLPLISDLRQTIPSATMPAVYEDLAVVVDETLPAEQVETLIRQTGGKIVSDVRLFDLYQGEKVGKGKKSLAYSITYQSAEKTLSDKDVASIRTRILKRLEQELGAKLRS